MTKTQKKGGKRVRSNAQAVHPEPGEIKKEMRRKFDIKVAETIQDAETMCNMLYSMKEMEEVIDFRRKQLNLDEDWELISDGEVNVKELFEGTTKPASMLKAQLKRNLFQYKSQVRQFERMKEKFEKEYNFTPEDIVSILDMSFDWNEWANKVTEDYESKETEQK